MNTFKKLLIREYIKAKRCYFPQAFTLARRLTIFFFFFFLLLDQKEAKLKVERCYCPRAFTLARRSAGPRLF
jgi:hypothetical protein